ncbi:hypothetical protein THAOC_12463, partial [Thalassiosira oceanica]
QERGDCGAACRSGIIALESRRASDRGVDPRAEGYPRVPQIDSRSNRAGASNELNQGTPDS